VKAGIQDFSAAAVAPCSGQGQVLDPRFRGGDGEGIVLLRMTSGEGPDEAVEELAERFLDLGRDLTRVADRLEELRPR
jgi:hypothetical protein